MPDQPDLPDDLKHLIEKREQADRRHHDRRDPELLNAPSTAELPESEDRRLRERRLDSPRRTTEDH